jgi:hypothetical protein
MEFSHTATFPASFEDVVKTSASADFLAQLEIPEVAAPTLVSANDDGSETEIAYEYTGQLDPMAKMLLKNKPLTWVQKTSIDMAAKTGTMDVVYMDGSIPGECTATVTFTEDGGSTTRTIEGKVVVKIMGVGTMVEKRLVEGIDVRFQSEAESLTAYLQK